MSFSCDALTVRKTRANGHFPRLNHNSQSKKEEKGDEEEEGTTSFNRVLTRSNKFVRVESKRSK